MPILKIKRHHNPYVILDKRCLADDRLSWKARGLLAYLLSKPDDWTVSTEQLAKASPQGIKAVRSGMKELIACGYAQLQTITGEDGRFKGSMYVISEGIEATSIPRLD